VIFWLVEKAVRVDNRSAMQPMTETDTKTAGTNSTKALASFEIEREIGA
jgi:hypothetical protein